MHEKGWEKNSVGRLFRYLPELSCHDIPPSSHKFGYGLLDAAEMVKLSKGWKESPAQVSCLVGSSQDVTLKHICETRVETVDKELGKEVGMGVNVSLITDGCDNMLSKVLLLFLPR